MSMPTSAHRATAGQRPRTFVLLALGLLGLVARGLSAPAQSNLPDSPPARAQNAASPSAGSKGTRPTSAGAAVGQVPLDPPVQSNAAPNPALLKQYCVTCHSERLKTGGLVLEGLDTAKVAPEGETWEKVVRKIRTGMMPPSGAPRPSRTELDSFAGALEARLDAARVPGAHLESSTLHRLNRTEYANAVRDLLTIDADVSTLLPGDGSSQGFDNLAEGLSVSPTLVQAYVAAAMKISRQAVGDRTLPQSTITYAAPPALAQDTHADGLPLGTRGGMVIKHYFPLDAEYEISASGGADITIDGEPLGTGLPAGAPAPGGRGVAAGAPAPGGRGGAPGGAPGAGAGPIGGRGGAAGSRPRVKVTAGPHAIGAAVVDRTHGGGADDIYSDFRNDATFTAAGGVSSVVITGPFNATGPGDTPSRRIIFSCRPDTQTEGAPTPASAKATATSPKIEAGEAACARKIFSTLARRAYRGPVSAAEIDTLMTFYNQGRRDGDFESGVQQGLARILVSPRFVYRVENQPAAAAIGAVYRISDIDLASRLSFFLWSSIPDEELLRVAERGTLHTPAVLQQQVRRMVADPKSDALTRNFAGQWLYLRELATLQTEAKNFDDSLRQSFRRETEMLFDAIVHEDRSLIDLLDADYTFVDERLARHYGIPNVRGSYFRRVALDRKSPRRGLIGQGSMLTVTSVATRTSPVSRGKWILENLFGAPPPQPPPGVEVNLDQPANEKPTTLRQRMELHRKNPVCASCHRIMDPIGFSLENFDLVGAWREADSGAPIDASGQLADGTPLAGPEDLRRALLSRSDAFVTTAAEKLMTYAIGRPVRYTDMPEIRAITRRTMAQGNRFSTLLMGVITSDQFQKRVKVK